MHTVYVFKNNNIPGQYKIGITGNIDQRLLGSKTYGVDFSLYRKFEVPDKATAKRLESLVLNYFESDKYPGSCGTELLHLDRKGTERLMEFMEEQIAGESPQLELELISNQGREISTFDNCKSNKEISNRQPQKGEKLKTMTPKQANVEKVQVVPTNTNNMHINGFQFQLEDENIYIDSEIVAKGFDIQHKNVCEVVSKHFTRLKRIKSSGTGGRPKTVYLLTERQIMIIPAIAKPTSKTIAFQTALVDAFLEARKQLEQSRQPDTRTDETKLAEGLLIAHRKMQELQDRNEKQFKQLEQAKCNTEYLNRIHGNAQSITATHFAKLIKVKPRTFTDWLFGKSRCCYRRGKNVFHYEKYSNWLETVSVYVDNGSYEKHNVKIKPEGRLPIYKKAKKEFNLPDMSIDELFPID